MLWIVLSQFPFNGLGGKKRLENAVFDGLSDPMVIIRNLNAVKRSIAAALYNFFLSLLSL